MKLRKLKCFIASALGRKDVNNIYHKALKPVLLSLNADPLRVDQVVHNDDIDNKILELINDCDFCIADLTYARPSVYYEAGRCDALKKPVIYTVRADHLGRKSKDDDDSLRVHFDLQMKNIIAWTRPNETFRRALRSRIEKAIKPLIEQVQIAAASREAENKFKRLSQNKQKDAVLATLSQQIEQLRFKSLTVNGPWLEPYGIFYKQNNDATILVLAVTTASLTKDKIRHLRFFPRSTYFTGDLKALKFGMNVESHVICCSLRPVPDSRITDEFSNLTPNSDRTIFSEEPHTSSGTKSNMFLHVIGNITSEKSFSEKLEQHLKTFS